MDVREAINTIEIMIIDAERVYRENKRSGSPAVSTAYDSGRIAGLREAMDIVRGVTEGVNGGISRGGVK